PLTSLVLLTRPPPISTLFPYTTLFRSRTDRDRRTGIDPQIRRHGGPGLHPRGHRGAGGDRAVAVARPAADHRRIADADSAFGGRDRKSTRLNSSHQIISYAVFCLKKKK